MSGSQDAHTQCVTAVVSTGAQNLWFEDLDRRPHVLGGRRWSPVPEISASSSVRSAGPAGGNYVCELTDTKKQQMCAVKIFSSIVPSSSLYSKGVKHILNIRVGGLLLHNS